MPEGKKYNIKKAGSKKKKSAAYKRNVAASTTGGRPNAQRTMVPRRRAK